MLESNLSARLDSAAMGFGDEMFPFPFSLQENYALNSWGEAPTFLPTWILKIRHEGKQIIFDDEQSDIRGFSHFIASSGELPRTYSVRSVCVTNLATSATRGFSFTYSCFCLRALFSYRNYERLIFLQFMTLFLFQFYMQSPK